MDIKIVDQQSLNSAESESVINYFSADDASCSYLKLPRIEESQEIGLRQSPHSHKDKEKPLLGKRVQE